MDKNCERELLAHWRRLSPARRREILLEIEGEAGMRGQVVDFPLPLSDPEVLEEARRLARGASIRLADLAAVVDPQGYPQYFARSWRATLARLAHVDHSRVGEALETVVEVQAYAPIQFDHRLVVPFALHIVYGRVTVSCASDIYVVERRRVVTLPGVQPVKIAAGAGAWFTYVPHPLTEWIAGRSRERAKYEQAG